jgi:hypothetical protein
MPRERIHDRRAGTRFEIVGRLPGTVEAVGVLRVKNITEDGALVEAPWPLSATSQHSARLDSSAGSFNVQLKVCHVTAAPHGPAADRYSIGFQFLTLDGQLRTIIRQLPRRQNPDVKDG